MSIFEYYPNRIVFPQSRNEVFGWCCCCLKLCQPLQYIFMYIPTYNESKSFSYYIIQQQFHFFFLYFMFKCICVFSFRILLCIYIFFIFLKCHLIKSNFMQYHVYVIFNLWAFEKREGPHVHNIYITHNLFFFAFLILNIFDNIIIHLSWT